MEFLRKSLLVCLAACLPLGSALAAPYSWVNEDVPNGLGTRDALGCQRIAVRLVNSSGQNHSFSTDRNFTIARSLLSPHEDSGCSQWLDSNQTVTLQRDTNILEFWAFAAGEDLNSTATINGTSETNAFPMSFTYSSSADPTTVTAPDPIFSGPTTPSEPVGNVIFDTKYICGIQVHGDGAAILEPCGGYTKKNAACADSFVQWNINKDGAGGEALLAIATTAQVNQRPVVIGMAEGQCEGAYDRLFIIKMAGEAP